MIKKILKLSIVGKTNAGKSTFINNIVGETVSIQNKKSAFELVRDLERAELVFFGFMYIVSCFNFNPMLLCFCRSFFLHHRTRSVRVFSQCPIKPVPHVFFHCPMVHFLSFLFNSFHYRYIDN